jgi:Tfp pilus assembly pilus retraction ATPase PilT
MMALRQTRELEGALQAAADRSDVSAVLLIPNEPVSFRIEGQIERTEGEALAPEEIHDIAAAALGEDALARVGGEVSEVMTSCALPGVVDGRLCVTRSLGSYSIVIRILPRACDRLRTGAIGEDDHPVCASQRDQRSQGLPYRHGGASHRHAHPTAESRRAAA